MSSSTVLITDPLHPDGVELLRRQPGFSVLVLPPDHPELAAHLGQIDAWIVRSGTQIGAEQIARCPRLKIIARAGVGVDNIDVNAATRRGVLVVNAPDGNAITTAELAIAHMFSLARHLVAADRMVRSGGWDRKALVGSELHGKVVGVAGLGRIGRHVAQRAAALGMRVLGHDPFIAPGALARMEIELVSRDELYARSDYLTLHVPLMEKTRGMLDAAAFARMKRGIRIINCARGPLVVAADLAQALDSGQVAGAAIDVFDPEPPGVEHVLVQHSRVVLTPHLGASTREAARNVAVSVAEQVLAYLQSRQVSHAVNMPPLPAEAARQMQPYLALARQCGRFLAQVVEWPISTVKARYRGEVSELPTAPLTQSFLLGLLEQTGDCPVNLVSAPALARERGWVVSEQRSAQPRDFESMLSFRVETPRGRRRIAGALFGYHMPRIVILDGARIEVVPDGHLIVLRNEDRPGVVGRIGTLLGQNGVNIANMHVSPPLEDGLCYAVLQVANRLDDAVLDQIAGLPEIREVHRVDLT